MYVCVFLLHLYEILISHVIYIYISQLKKRPDLNASLSDICISTSAAPTYLPAHSFETKTHHGVSKFDLIDGGVAANNPVHNLIIQMKGVNFNDIIQI